jgi:hypothetical protein
MFASACVLHYQTWSNMIAVVATSARRHSRPVVMFSLHQLTGIFRAKKNTAGFAMDYPYNLTWKLLSCLLLRNSLRTHIFCMSLMKQPFVVTHRYRILQDREKNYSSSIDQEFSTLCFYGNITTSNISVDTKFWQVCLYPSCLVMRQSQFDKLRGLPQIAFPWATCYISQIQP